MEKKIREPISALTHLLGFLILIPIIMVMIVKAWGETSIYHVVSLTIFGVSLLLLYATSTIYHSVNVKPEYIQVLRRVDHMMIFVLIAGTYTPICLIPLGGPWGWTLLALVWGFAIAGIILKAIWINVPRWFSTLLYVLMGWLVVIAFVPLKSAIPVDGIMLLIAGGVTYTLGAVIYAMKWPKLNFKSFGFHEIFHLFVIGGTSFHTVFMFKYILF